jgi:hypothetical protein
VGPLQNFHSDIPKVCICSSMIRSCIPTSSSRVAIIFSPASQAARAGARLVEYESTLAAMHTDLKKKDELINMIHNLAKNAPAAGR